MKANSKRKAGVDRSHGRSIAERTSFICGHFLIFAICFWFVQYEGFSKLGQIFGRSWGFSDPVRASIMLGCTFLYWVRHVFTLLYLLPRKVEWGEVLGLLSFFATFEIGLLLVGGGAFREHARSLNWPDILALFFLIAGSFLNSVSELQRKLWKKHSANKGHCYTRGLFKYSMHINYFGDTMMFSGWCLFSANNWTLILPVLMAASFIFYHIPALDAYLAQRYGEEFQAYSKKTKRFIPFIY